VPEIKTTLILNNQPVEGLDIPFTQLAENLNEYKLEDGTILRVKFTVASVVRLADQPDLEGNPTYIVRGTLVTFPIVPENLKKKKA
jgi:hypothetical protein